MAQPPRADLNRNEAHRVLDVERPIRKLMSWLTENWLGSNDRDADLQDGITTIQRVKAAVETGDVQFHP